MKYSFITSLLFFVLLSACSGPEASQEQAPSQRAVPVYVQELQPSTFNHYINIQGTVESDKTIMITPKVSATVESVEVSAGEVVEKGEVLARLDGEVTKSQIAEVKTQLELARTVYERQKNLRSQDIGSEIELLQAETDVKSLESQLATLQEQYANYTISATIGGTVNKVLIKEGEFVSSTMQAFQLANSEALKVTAELSEAYINRIDLTDSVTISLPSIDWQLTKTLDVVSKVIDPSNRTFAVEIYLPNGNNQIRPNMIAKLRINDYSESNQIVVPINVVQQTNEGGFLFLAKQNGSGWISQRQQVETGRSYGSDIVIEQGLQPGDRIITTGYTNVANNGPIEITQSK